MQIWKKNAYVEKDENPPNAPQIRLIENYWGILKMKGYEGNWSAKDWLALIRRIKLKQKEIDQDIVMFKKLKQKVHTANPDGFSILVKI